MPRPKGKGKFIKCKVCEKKFWVQANRLKLYNISTCSTKCRKQWCNGMYLYTKKIIDLYVNHEKALMVFAFYYLVKDNGEDQFKAF